MDKKKLPLIKPRLPTPISTSTATTNTTTSATTSTTTSVATATSITGTAGEVFAVPNVNNNLVMEEFMRGDPVNYAAKLKISEMAKLLLILNDAYYKGTPLVSDRQFDDIQEILSLLDPENPVLKEIGAEATSDFETETFSVEKYPHITGTSFPNPFYRSKVKLPFLMPSMDKVKPKDISEYNNWISKNPGPYNLSDKVDGMSVALVYELTGQTITRRLFSRGEKGVEGEELSAIIPYLRLPLPSPTDKNIVAMVTSSGGKLYMRGEVIISKETFEKEIGQGAMRNIARGIMSRKTLHTGFLALLDLVVYELVHPWKGKMTDSLLLLKQLGFNVVHNEKIQNTLTLEELRTYLQERNKLSAYEIDGIIISRDDVASRDIKPGDKFPSYAIAFKYDSDSSDNESAITIVRTVTWEPSRYGKLSPVAIVKPVGLYDSRNENFTVHNARHVVDMNIGPGAIIRVTKGGKIIPHIVATLRPAVPMMPDMPYVWDATNKSISLVEPEKDKTVYVARFQNFFEKLSVPNWGPANVERIVNKYWPTPIDVFEILNISEKELSELNGDKMGKKLYDSLHEKLSKVNLTTLMAASNVFGAGWGERRFQALFEGFPDILRHPFLSEKDRDDLLQRIIDIHGFNIKTGATLLEGLPNFIAFLYGIYRIGWIGTFILQPLPRTFFPASAYDRIIPEIEDQFTDMTATMATKEDLTDDDYKNASEIQQELFQAIDIEEAAVATAAAAATAASAPVAKKVLPRTAPKITPVVTSGITATAAAAATIAAPVQPQIALPKIAKPIAAAKPAAAPAKPSLLGKTIVFTGVHKGVEDEVTMRGAKITGSISGNTDLLVIKDSSFTSSKVVKAQQLGTPIMTLADFTSLYL
jgi:DNA ligase (NAD+)